MQEEKTQPKALSASDILGADDLSSELVEIPEWPDAQGNPGVLYLYELTGTEREAWEQSCVKMKRGKKGQMIQEPDMIDFRAKLLARAIRDEKGKKIFQPSEVRKLSGKSAAVLDRLYEQAKKLSGISEEDVEGLAGNSEDGQDDTV